MCALVCTYVSIYMYMYLSRSPQYIGLHAAVHVIDQCVSILTMLVILQLNPLLITMLVILFKGYGISLDKPMFWMKFAFTSHGGTLNFLQPEGGNHAYLVLYVNQDMSV